MDGDERSEVEKSERAVISPELVRQIADKVYALLLKDLQIEKERKRGCDRRWDR